MKLIMLFAQFLQAFVVHTVHMIKHVSASTPTNMSII